MAVTQSAVKPKIYHLLDVAKSTAEVYQRVNKDQRVRVQHKPNERPYLQATYFDGEQNRTIRLKLTSNSIYQDEQIEKGKIPANERFTDAERRVLEFHNGVLVATNRIVQEFLDKHPQNEAFQCECPEIPQKLFKEYNPEVKAATEVNAFKRRVAAATKITELELNEAQTLLIRLYGSFYKVPDNLNDCIQQLVAYLDEADENGVEEILREGQTLQDEVNILIGLALKKDIISFNEQGMENFVVKKKNGTVVPLKEISAVHPIQERKRYLAEFMVSQDGRLLLEDLRKEVNASDSIPENKQADAKTKKKEAAMA